eukprot:scaffold19184_cov80-Skeletonema_marinoi.AAC.1
MHRRGALEELWLWEALVCLKMSVELFNSHNSYLMSQTIECRAIHCMGALEELLAVGHTHTHPYDLPDGATTWRCAGCHTFNSTTPDECCTIL